MFSITDMWENCVLILFLFSAKHESILASLKKKHLDAVAEMSEQIDQLNKMKQKVEKEKHAKRLQIDELKAAQDAVANERASCEKQNKAAQAALADVTRETKQFHKAPVNLQRRS